MNTFQCVRQIEWRRQKTAKEKLNTQAQSPSIGLPRQTTLLCTCVYACPNNKSFPLRPTRGNCDAEDNASVDIPWVRAFMTFTIKSFLCPPGNMGVYREATYQTELISSPVPIQDKLQILKSWLTTNTKQNISRGEYFISLIQSSCMVQYPNNVHTKTVKKLQ